MGAPHQRPNAGCCASGRIRLPHEPHPEHLHPTCRAFGHPRCGVYRGTLVCEMRAAIQGSSVARSVARVATVLRNEGGMMPEWLVLFNVIAVSLGLLLLGYITYRVAEHEIEEQVDEETPEDPCPECGAEGIDTTVKGLERRRFRCSECPAIWGCDV